jgi:hypothetical protein
VAAEAVKKIETFNAGELANTVWAFSTATVEAPLLFEAVAEEAPKKILFMGPQALANTVWAFSNSGFESVTLFKALGRALDARLYSTILRRRRAEAAASPGEAPSESRGDDSPRGAAKFPETGPRLARVPRSRAATEAHSRREARDSKSPRRRAPASKPAKVS